MGGHRKKITIKGLKGLTISISESIDPIAQEWDKNCGDNVYVRSAYLRLLEESGPIGYCYYYLSFELDDKNIGLLYCQHKTLILSKDYRLHSHSDSVWEKLRVQVSKFLFKWIKHEMLICGNVLLTGEFGMRLDESVHSFSSELIPLALEELKDYILAKKGKKIQSTLLKDFYTEGPLKQLSFTADSYSKFEVQPDMVLTLDPAWKNYTDYLSAVKSKYRVKFKKIKKKGQALLFRQLDEQEALHYNADMYGMYKDTADRATFSLFLLDEDYFSKLKKVFGDEIILTGVFLEEKMVAFFTYVKNGSQGDAHFLGYNVALNAKYQIYFNILLKLVETSIDEQSTYLNLSRTALEIKSSVGAEPHPMQVQLKYHSAMINKRLPSILSRFIPDSEWLPRSPFK